MTLTQAKPTEGLSLGCAAVKKRGRKRLPKVGGYVTENTYEELKAVCWYARTTQSAVITKLLIDYLRQLQETGQLTSSIINEYRKNCRRPAVGRSTKVFSVMLTDQNSSHPIESEARLAAPVANLILAANHRTQLLRSKTEDFTAEEHQVVRRGEYAFRKLFQVYRKLIFSLVGTYNNKGYSSHNLDLEQEATLVFYDAVVSYDPNKGASLGTWAYYKIRVRLQSLTGRVIKEMVATAKYSQSESTVTEPEPLPEYQLIDGLPSLVDRLTPKQQEVVSLSLDGWGWTEIALKLQSTADAVRMLWNRAIRGLRQLINDKSNAQPQAAIAVSQSDQ